MKLTGWSIFIIIIIFVLLGGIGVAYQTTTTTTTNWLYDKCDNTVCVTGHSTGCDSDTGTCLCKHEFEGALCEHKKKVCTAADCSNNGLPTEKFVGKDEPCDCTCQTGFKGTTCAATDLIGVDLSKSVCIVKGTCLKNGNRWGCINGNYLSRGDGSPSSFDCLPCPSNSKIIDVSYTGQDNIIDCKCLDDDDEIGGKYMDTAEQKCNECSKHWSLNDGKDGKIIVTPKDSNGNPINNWVIYNVDKSTPEGTFNDCKCNNKKHFYNSRLKKNNCVRCHKGAELKKFNNVEICVCKSPDWTTRMITRNRERVSVCIENRTCQNPEFPKEDGTYIPDKKMSKHYCARRDTYGEDLNKARYPGNLVSGGDAHKDFAHPVDGQVTCSLRITDAEKKRTLLNEDDAKATQGSTAKAYLELNEKVKHVTSLMNTARGHITGRKYNQAITVLNDALLKSKGYGGLSIDEKVRWKGYKFNSTGRTETIYPSGGWPQVKVSEIRPHMIGRLVFGDNEITNGGLMKGATVKQITECGTNPMGRDFKIDKVLPPSRNSANPGVIPILGDNFDPVLRVDIGGTDCLFQRVLNSETETKPIQELDATGVSPQEIRALITIAAQSKLFEEENARIAKDQQRQTQLAALIKLDKKGCVDTAAGLVLEENDETKCANIAASERCDSDFAVVNCRKTCGHNTSTCSEEGFVNSWESFGNM